jgi:hypothetical protein
MTLKHVGEIAATPPMGLVGIHRHLRISIRWPQN